MRSLREALRPTLRVETLLLVVALYLVLALNGRWWTEVLAGRSGSHPSTWLFAAATAVALTGLHFVLLAPVASRWTVRPLLTVTVILSAAVAYYMRTFAVIMDPTMIQNVLATDLREARELLSLSMVLSVIAWSALPLAFIWVVRLERVPWPRAFVVRLASISGASLVAAVALLGVSRDLSSLMRNRHELRYLITPGNYIYGLASSSSRRLQRANLEREIVGGDAHLTGIPVPARRPRVFVLVLGETARAANFALLGYDRPTTPELSGKAVIAFRDVTACGTSTEVSLPCMFSSFGRAEYDEARIRNSEGLLDVLVRAGVDVDWFENQSGCKGVCRGAGIHYEKIDPKAQPESCTADECHDDVLVQRLRTRLADIRKDTAIVLHMMGNHGPAYYRRYPPAFRRFSPECATAELRRCSRAEVINAYDNAILYTDHILASVIHALQEHSRSVDAAMLYVSDHGESLGEQGLYLHGIPFSIAPGVQTRVPMIAWLSPEFATTARLDDGCLRRKSDMPLSHDNLFHSVLGVLDVETSAYRGKLDFFRACRQQERAPQRVAASVARRMRAS